MTLYELLLTAPQNPPETLVRSLDITAIVVAVLGAIAAVTVAVVQLKGRVEEKGKREKAEKSAEQAGVSEAAMANVAEKSLQLLESLLDNERRENAALHDLLSSSQEKILDNHKIIGELTSQLTAKDNKIKELELELGRLRGRMDQILNREDREYGRA